MDCPLAFGVCSDFHRRHTSVNNVRNEKTLSRRSAKKFMEAGTMSPILDQRLIQRTGLERRSDARCFLWMGLPRTRDQVAHLDGFLAGPQTALRSFVDSGWADPMLWLRRTLFAGYVTRVARCDEFCGAPIRIEGYLKEPDAPLIDHFQSRRRALLSSRRGIGEITVVDGSRIMGIGSGAAGGGRA